MEREVKANVLIIGLGAGYLNSYLYGNFPKMDLTGVEIEQEMVRVARKWFGLVIDSRQRIYTMDGAKFIETATTEGRKYDVIILDACLVDMSLELQCPIKPFLQAGNVKTISRALTEKGLLILSLQS
ncbi:hypothetical protein COOONC_04935 [Cooperia oncophora]